MNECLPLIDTKNFLFSSQVSINPIILLGRPTIVIDCLVNEYLLYVNSCLDCDSGFACAKNDLNALMSPNYGYGNH